jgi:hypothetical protein
MGEEGLDSTSALRVAIILSIYFIFISEPSGKTVEMFLPNTFTLLHTILRTKRKANKFINHPFWVSS